MMPEAMERYVEQATKRIAELEDDTWKLRNKLDNTRDKMEVLFRACDSVASMLGRTYDKASVAEVAANGMFSAAILHAIQDLQAATDTTRSME